MNVPETAVWSRWPAFRPSFGEQMRFLIRDVSPWAWVGAVLTTTGMYWLKSGMDRVDTLFGVVVPKPLTALPTCLFLGWMALSLGRLSHNVAHPIQRRLRSDNYPVDLSLYRAGHMIEFDKSVCSFVGDHLIYKSPWVTFCLTRTDVDRVDLEHCLRLILPEGYEVTFTAKGRWERGSDDGLEELFEKAYRHWVTVSVSSRTETVLPPKSRKPLTSPLVGLGSMAVWGLVLFGPALIYAAIKALR